MTAHSSTKEGIEAVKYVTIFVTVAVLIMLVLIVLTNVLS